METEHRTHMLVYEHRILDLRIYANNPICCIQSNLNVLFKSDNLVFTCAQAEQLI
jgi:hypothetical protein